MKNILSKSDIDLLRKIVSQDYITLLKEIREKDYNRKKWLIETIEYYKAAYKKAGKDIDKLIAEGLMEELEELNGMIKRIKDIVK